MLNFVHSDETASKNIADALSRLLEFGDYKRINGLRCREGGGARLISITGKLIEADFLNAVHDGPIMFLSRHSSAKGIPSFTVHAEGNWSMDNRLGGMPKELSVSSPTGMLDTLAAIGRLNATGMQVTYEATHHGPMLDVPSYFVELGGDEAAISNAKYAELLAEAIADSMRHGAEYGKIAIGIGGTHYPEKFTRLGLEGRYAFGHIMSRHYTGCADMIEKAVLRCDSKTEIAVIEWKSIKAGERKRVVEELNKMGLDYERI